MSNRYVMTHTGGSIYVIQDMDFYDNDHDEQGRCIAEVWPKREAEKILDALNEQQRKEEIIFKMMSDDKLIEELLSRGFEVLK